jgi:arylsulfatase A-like enzyme
MDKKSNKFNHLAKFTDALKIGAISGLILGFAEGLALAINIIKDNEKNFLFIASAFKFLNIPIVIYSLFLLSANLIIYILIKAITKYVSPKFQFVLRKDFFIWINIAIIGCIPAGIWWNINFRGPFTHKHALIGDLVIIIFFLLISLAIILVSKKFKPHEALFKRINKKKINLFILVWISVIIIAFIVPFIYSEAPKNGDNINVLLIIIDALRADHLGCYGYEKNTSPAIDKLANKGAIFLNTIAQWPSSTASHASIFTSTYPHTHQCFPNGAKLNSNLKTIAELLKKNGYSTTAFIDNPLISKRANFNQGFDSFYSRNRFYLKNVSPKFIFHSINIVRIFDKVLHRNMITMFALDWLKRNHKQQFFLVLQYIEPHSPYFAHSEIDLNKNNYKAHNSLSQRDENIKNEAGEHKISLYDGEIAYADLQIKKIIENLNHLAILDKTLIIITADHGENLLDHQPYFAHKNLYDSSIRIPLIFYYEKKINPIKIEKVVESVDIVPTILNILDIAPIKQFEGKSLYPYSCNSASYATSAGFSEEITPDLRKVCIRTHDWKLIINFKKSSAPEELYNIKEDTSERKIIQNNEKVSAILRKKLLHWLRQSERAEKYFLKFDPLPTRKLSRETLKMLRSLGYID